MRNHLNMIQSKYTKVKQVEAIPVNLKILKIACLIARQVKCSEGILQQKHNNLYYTNKTNSNWNSERKVE